MNIRELLKDRDSYTIELLYKQFEKAIYKYSYRNGRIDDELYSEQLFAFLKCIQRFNLNELYFRSEFEKVQL